MSLAARLRLRKRPATELPPVASAAGYSMWTMRLASETPLSLKASIAK